MDPISNIANSLGDWLFASPKAADPALRGSGTLTFADLLPQAQAALAVRAADPGTESTAGRGVSDAENPTGARRFLPARSDEPDDSPTGEAETAESDLDTADASDPEAPVHGDAAPDLGDGDGDDRDGSLEATIGTHVRLDSDAPAVPDAFEASLTVDVEVVANEPTRSEPAPSRSGAQPIDDAVRAVGSDRENAGVTNRLAATSRPIERAARAYAASVPTRDAGAAPLPRVEGIRPATDAPANSLLKGRATAAPESRTSFRPTELGIMDPRIAAPRVADPRVPNPRPADPRSATEGPRPIELRTPELRTPELRTSELRTSELRTSELRTAELRTAELRTPEPRTPELRTPDNRALDSRIPGARSTSVGQNASPVAERRDRVPLDLRTVPPHPAEARSWEPRPTSPDVKGAATPRTADTQTPTNDSSSHRVSAPQAAPARGVASFVLPTGNPTRTPLPGPLAGDSPAAGTSTPIESRPATPLAIDSPQQRPANPAAAPRATEGRSPYDARPVEPTSGDRTTPTADTATVAASTNASAGTERRNHDATRYDADIHRDRSTRTGAERSAGVVDSRAPAATTASSASPETGTNGTASNSATSNGTETSGSERLHGAPQRETTTATNSASHTSNAHSTATPLPSPFESLSRAALDRTGATHSADSGRAADPSLDASVLRQIQGRFDPSRSEIRLRLTPEHLGEVRMNVRLVDGRVHVVLDAEHASTRHLLDRNLPELRETLARAGVSIEDVRLTTHDDAPRSRAATASTASPTDGSDTTPSRDDAPADDGRSQPGSREAIRSGTRFTLDGTADDDSDITPEPRTASASPPIGSGIGTRLNLVV